MRFVTWYVNFIIIFIPNNLVWLEAESVSKYLFKTHCVNNAERRVGPFPKNESYKLPPVAVLSMWSVLYWKVSIQLKFIEEYSVETNPIWISNANRMPIWMDCTSLYHFFITEITGLKCDCWAKSIQIPKLHALLSRNGTVVLTSSGANSSAVLSSIV